MKLTNLAAQRMLGTLRGIDSSETVKLAGLSRLTIARNINKLMPDVLAFETVANKKQREVKMGPEHMEANKQIQEEITALADATLEITLVPMELKDLNLDENMRITGDMLAALAPIIKDFDAA